ncbi:MAG: bifunctional serine/threonine-protein kinase/formylglycine-generating enzyme family protein [Myxococcota bacterium]
MREDLDELCRRFGIAGDARAALVRLLDPASSASTLVVDDAEPGEPAGLDLGPRYEDVGPLGHGATCEVRRVRDRQLERDLAMKILRPDLSARPGALGRFLGEARMTAGLEHPGVIPVHDAGQLPDGRYFFTMKEVRGDTFGQVLARRGDPDGWTLHRLVDVWRRTCEAIAHAHARGVIHRDLKPDNVMVGAFGEVLVLDWGLARQRAVVREPGVAGTPLYMPPEQARGEPVDARADVYALGAVLYEVLAGRAPYAGETAEDVLAAVIAGPPPPPEGPDELVDLCRRAMARDPGDRPADAGELASAVTEWLEGARKRERALALVADADGALPTADALRARAARKRQEAARALEHVRPWEPVERKVAAWRLEDEARRLEAEADLVELAATQALQGALTHVADLPEAHDRLARLYRARHDRAEAARLDQEAARFEALVRAHDRGRLAGWLSRRGRLSLATDRPAHVTLCRYVERDRRLVAELVRELGATPLADVELPMGSYLLRLAAPGCEPLPVPVFVARDGHVRLPLVRLPRAGELGPDDLLVAGGPAPLGGDPEAPTGFDAHEVDVAPFVLRRFPVTNREYLAFLDDLVATGREREALAHAPRERPPSADREGALIYGRDEAGRFVLPVDKDGDAWDPDYPVVMVDWASACAYARWLGEKTGQPWRLPAELEWEKAARGVDRRFFPWGDPFDATWANTRESRPGRPLPARVHEFPGDESPYGVRGMAGNVMEWCADAYLREGGEAEPRRVMRGGSWNAPSHLARACVRRGTYPAWRGETLGFRIARDA